MDQLVEAMAAPGANPHRQLEGVEREIVARDLEACQPTIIRE